MQLFTPRALPPAACRRACENLTMSALSPTTKYEFRNPVLGHIHVPKCAGTSFAKYLTGAFGAAHLLLYCNHDTFFVYSEEDLASYLADPSIKAFSSHFVRTFPRPLAERDVLYLTFLRNPVEQFISYLTYVRKHFADIQHHPDLISCLPPNLPALSLREAARWILNSEREVNFRENFTVNFFARFPSRDASRGIVDDKQYRKVRLAIAKSTLEDFFFVGITEQLDRSLRVLRALGKRCNIPIPDNELPFENVSREGRADVTWIHSGDEVGALLLNSVREDQLLYNFAVARLEQAERSDTII
jgi:hypothetical protein